MPQRKRFARVPIEVALARDLSHRELRLYVVLALHANTQGNAWPTQATLASESGIERRNLQRVLHDLEAKGYIEVLRARPNSLAPNVYHLPHLMP